MVTVTKKLPTILFALGIVILLIPVFSMGYLFSLDSPAHFYNALINNDLLLNGDSGFYEQYIGFNSEFTPNLIGLVWAGFLLKIFSPIIAIKLFNVSFILLFSTSIYYSLKGILKDKLTPLTIVFILPFITSTFITTGFINFYLSFIFLFLTIGYYIRIQEFNWKNLLTLTFLILITYLGHSIVFGFLLLLIGAFEITKNLFVIYNFKEFFKATFRSVMIALPPIIFTVLFLGTRKSEIAYLSLPELSYNLITMNSLLLFKTQGVYFSSLFAIILLVSVMAITIWRVKKKEGFKQSDFLLLSSLLFLVCYFILPDSVGFASVFSVRISYFFWLTLVCWLIVEVPRFKYLTIGLSTFSLLFILWNTSIQYSEYKKLNSVGKEVIYASKFIENESVVYPVFASNVWNHYHFNNLLGLQKPMLILENTCARQDYFPIQYINPYEKCLQKFQTLDFSCNSQHLQIDYIFVLGRESITNPLDKKLLNEAKRKNAEMVYHTNFIKIYKVR